MQYISKSYIGRKKYEQNIKIIQINFSYGLNKEKAIYKYELKNEENEKFVNNFEIYEINMEYFMKNWCNKNQDEINKYKYFIMLNLEKEDLEILSKKDKMVRKYMGELNTINEDPTFIQYMTDEDDREAIWIAKYNELYEEFDGKFKMLDEKNKELDKKHKELDEKHKELDEKHKKINEDISYSIEQEKYEIASKLLKSKIDINIISEVTGLSLEQLKQLK